MQDIITAFDTISINSSDTGNDDDEYTSHDDDTASTSPVSDEDESIIDNSYCFPHISTRRHNYSRIERIVANANTCCAYSW